MNTHKISYSSMESPLLTMTLLVAPCRKAGPLVVSDPNWPHRQCHQRANHRGSKALRRPLRPTRSEWPGEKDGELQEKEKLKNRYFGWFITILPLRQAPPRHDWLGILHVKYIAIFGYNWTKGVLKKLPCLDLRRFTSSTYCSDSKPVGYIVSCLFARQTPDGF